MSQKKSLSSSRSWISSPSVNQLPQVDMGTTGLRLDTGRVLGLQLSSPVWLLGNTCRHSQGGEDSLLGPLPHLSPFTLQPVKWSHGEQWADNHQHDVWRGEKRAAHNLTCACASSSTAKEKNNVKSPFYFEHFWSHTHWSEFRQTFMMNNFHSWVLTALLR